MGRLDNKVCIVTGAAGGMGRSHAKLLANEGAKLVLTDLNQDALDELASTYGDSAITLKHNVAEAADWEKVVDAAVSQFGKIDVLINNAGILKMIDFDQTTVEDWDLLHHVNSRGVFLGCKAVLPLMEEQKSGSIVNVSSISALQGMPLTIAYGASKGSVNALTKGLAVQCREKKTGVRVNSIHPDGVKTPMVVGNPDASAEEISAMFDNMSDNTNARMCEPEEISSVVVFLASDESKYVNGLEFLIDNAASITPPPAW
ncbi:MAG: SDR family oxidoreductase [Pseudomonadota bacterium]